MLAGKVALVTGGARGIGKAIGEELLKKKVKLSILDINENSLKESVKKFQSLFEKNDVIGFACDVTDEEEFEKRVLETKWKFGHLDLLINNAGIEEEGFAKKMIDVNFTGVVTGTELALRHLINFKGERTGMVINIASLAGFLKLPLAPCYTATKHAVLAYTRCIGSEKVFQNTGIKVNAVCPDFTDTLLIHRVLQDKEIRKLHESVHKGKLLKASEVAEYVIKVIEDNLTGAVFVISIRKGPYYLPNTDIIDLQ